MAQLVKTVNNLAIASVKTVENLAIASVKTIDGLDNTSGGGGASAFVFSQSASNSDNAAVATVTFGSSIPAGCLIYVFIKWEGTGNPTGVTENGGGSFTAGTEPTPQEGGDLSCQGFWLLSATGGGTVINIAYTGTCTFTRAIAIRWTYGGTATKVASGQASAASGNPVSQSVSNSGSFRLNVTGIGNYTGQAYTNLLIGGVAGDAEPDAQVSDTWAWYNTEALSAETANCTLGSGAWVMDLECFAAN